MQSGKPKEIAEKMVEGRMKKFTGEVSLTGQPFVMEPSKTVGQLLKEHNAEVTGFIRFEVGEGIEKVEIDFSRRLRCPVLLSAERLRAASLCPFCKSATLVGWY